MSGGLASSTHRSRTPGMQTSRSSNMGRMLRWPVIAALLAACSGESRGPLAPAAVGAPSIAIIDARNSGAPGLYFHGIESAADTATITASAPGFADATASATVAIAGIDIMTLARVMATGSGGVVSVSAASLNVTETP